MDLKRSPDLAAISKADKPNSPCRNDVTPDIAPLQSDDTMPLRQGL